MPSLQEFLKSVKGINRSICTREKYGMPTIELKTKREFMLKLFDTLDNPQEINTVVLMYLDGISQNEIAERIDRSPRTVCRYHKAALAKLEKEWKNFNG